MKKLTENMRFIVAGLFVLSALLGFMNIFRIAVIKVSLVDLLKLGFGKGDTVLMRQLADVVKEYMKPFTYCLLGFFGMIVIIALLVAWMDWERGCKISVIGAFLVNAYILIVLFAVYSKLQDVKEGISFFGLENVIKIYKLPVILWIFIYLIIFIVGLREIQESENSRNIKVADDILPERVERKRSTEKDYLEKIQKLEREKKQRTMQENPGNSREQIWFEGAVKGINGLYTNQVYMLKDRTPVYVCEENGQVFLADEKQSNVFGEIYYVKEYEEYCVIPSEMKSCFLISGQPLGKERNYYIPRGTQIFIQNRDNYFELV